MEIDDLKTIPLYQMASLVPIPDAEDNKYTRGVLAVVGGSELYPGAAALAAHAAQRMGAGYTQVWCAPESVHDVRCGHPSLVVRSWDDPQMGRTLRARDTTLVVGCGFQGCSENEMQLLERMLELYYPTVVDGAGLQALAEYVDKNGFDLLKSRAQAGIPLVLTPHAGEAAHLMFAAGLIPVGQADIAQDLSESYYATVVMKGPKTVIWGEGNGYLMNQGTAALAKAGTGDVLAGIVGALLCQGLSAVDAGCFGASIHAHAGHLAATDLTMVSVTPEDVIAHLPHALKDYLALRA